MESIFDWLKQQREEIIADIIEEEDERVAELFEEADKMVLPKSEEKDENVQSNTKDRISLLSEMSGEIQELLQEELISQDQYERMFILILKAAGYDVESQSRGT